MSDKVALVRLRANNSQYDRAMRDSAKLTGDLQRGLGRFDSSKLDELGSKLTRNVTLPLAALGGFAVKAAGTFDSVFTKMQTLAGVTAGEVDGLKESIFALSGETGRAPTELAEAMYFLRSSGLDAAESMEALEASAKASAAGLGSTAVVADAVSSAMNAYAAAGLTAAEATDVLIATARAGKAEPEQLAASLGRVLPLASELGVTFQDVGGSIAALSLSGNDAAQASTLLTNVLSKILKPSKQGADALADVGLSAEKLRGMIADKGLLGTLQELREKLGTSGFVKLFEDAQAVQGVLALTGQNADQVAKAFDEVNNSAGGTESAFATWADSMGAKNSKAFADLQVALIEFGEKLAPLAADLLTFAASVATAFSNLPEPMQKGILAITGLTVAMGPFLKMGAAGIDVAQGLAKAWNSKALESFRLGLMGVSEAGGGATNKMGAFVSAVAGSPAALGAAAGAVAMLTAVLSINAEMAATAKRNVDLLLSGGQSAEAQLRSTLAATVSGMDGGFDLSNSGAAFREWIEETGTSADELYKILTGGQKEFDALLAGMKDKGDIFAADDLSDMRDAFGDATAKAQAHAQAEKELGIEADATAGAIDGLATEQDFASESADRMAQAESDVTSALDSQRSAADAVASAQASAAQARKGVVDAERAVGEARKGVEQATRGVTDAERGMADAQRSAADASAELAEALHDQQWGSEALEDANLGVVDAEKALAAAQRESKDAQDALNDARATAAERLRDLEEAVGDSAMDEEGARIALARAQERKAGLGADGEEVSGLDRREAALAVAEAQDRLQDVLARNAEMEAELADARKKGVEGSEEYLAAQERITEAAEGEKQAKDDLTTAQERVAEVHEEMALRVEEAQRKVEEANLRVQDAALRVRDAVDQVGEAQQRVTDATGAVVEARGKVEEAERGVMEAMVEEALAAFILEEQLKRNDEALRTQIERYDALAATLEPGSALRTRIEELRDELIALEGQYNVTVAVAVQSGLAEAGDAVAQGILDALDATRRAGGGDVQAGGSYLVGDRTGMANAEVFTPGHTGRLTPLREYQHMTASSDVRPVTPMPSVGGGRVEKGAVKVDVHANQHATPEYIGEAAGQMVAAKLLVMAAH